MSCRRQLEEARGNGGSAAKVDDDDDDDDEDLWSLGDDEETDTGGRQSYKKNKWHQQIRC